MSVHAVSVEASPAANAKSQGGSRDLPDRPVICTSQGSGQKSAAADSSQPGLGLAGLLVVIPVAVGVASGAGGLEPSLRIFGPLSTFALPVAAMIAFWWEDWPGSRLRPPLASLVDVLLVVAGGIAITALGQAVVGRSELGALFDPNQGPGRHSPTFPATMPLAGAFFVAMLQLTLVNEGWPLRNLPRLAAGPVALLVSWAIALSVYLTVVDTPSQPDTTLFSRAGHVLSGPHFSALLVAVSVWQVVFYILLRGWPFGVISRRSTRLPIANATVGAAGAISYVLALVAGLDAPSIDEIGGAVIAAVLLQGMLFDGVPRSPGNPTRERLTAIAIVAIVAAGVYFLVAAVAHAATGSSADAKEWIAFACLNAIGIAIILHVGISRRWPFTQVLEAA